LSFKIALHKKRYGMKRLVFTASALLLIFCAQAQPYKWALGGRLSYPAGIPSFKCNFTDHHTAEGILEFYHSGVQLVGLYEYHGDIKSVQNLRWYAGGGLGVGYRNKYPYYRALGKTTVASRGVLTLQPIVGIEYTLQNAPVNFSFDYKPQFDLLSGWFGFGGFGLGIRYTMK
jgi:hypothetical protein